MKRLLKRLEEAPFLLVKEVGGLSGTGGVLHGGACAEQVGVAIGYQES